MEKLLPTTTDLRIQYIMVNDLPLTGVIL